ncbi:Glycosyltransferase involved in cell wall bisynthesis [Cyclonatronum proteinivorum]|uniref:Glycosyltransferase involved in cell wall bisynthesis n=1 Tax=Cyclonatronum proteinivorum TaxID=1457365 RepID=A0A345UJ60_9BACT|nr:glycosyltransferase family 2 protein [Cyclonatronum proteinivorum]AXJ00512.1 Glycosyltransferase involved in cell wall bisynthesis [Cyclonatronum proteinivorum]
METVSVVIPLLDEQDSLPELYEKLCEALRDTYAPEFIFVDDGSTDHSWQVIEQLCADDQRVKGIRFKRNYGKSTALHYGFQQASGQYVATIDADLQDDPAEIPLLIEQMKAQNLDLVSGWKRNRQDPFTKTLPSRLFNFVTRKVTGIPLHDFNCGLKVYRQEVVGRLELYGERHRYIPLLAWSDGYRGIGEKKVVHHPRKHGVSKFGVSRFIYGFLDLVTLIFINFYMQRPMHFFGTAGVLSVAAGSLITTYLVIMRLFYGEFLARRPLLLFGILLILLGFQFFSVGLFGEMMVRQKRDTRMVNVAETRNAESKDQVV